MTIPMWASAYLDFIPADRPVVCLLRHAQRYAFNAINAEETVALTPEGIADSRHLGHLICSKMPLNYVATSPSLRCVSTSTLIAESVIPQAEIIHEERLTHDFIRSAFDAASIFRPGMGFPDQVTELFHLLLSPLNESRAGISFFVTHDTVITTMVCYLLAEPFNQAVEMDFMEGLFMWWETGILYLFWRGHYYMLNTRDDANSHVDDYSCVV